MTEAMTNAATEERNLTLYQDQFPALSDEIVETIIEDGKDAVLWLKVTDGGFRYGDDTFLSEIVGIITASDRYFVKWEDGKADKLYDVPDNDPPEGYEIRCDIQILTPELSLYGISLAPTSYIYGFSQYVRNLKKRDLDVTQVLTRLWTEERHNKFGKFNVVRFSIQEVLKQEEDSRDRIPF